MSSILPPPSLVLPKPTYNYPFASAPDIIRAHQKDTYFSSLIQTQLSTFLRHVYGARFIHTYTSEAQTLSELLYLSLTTLIGNRTLGEEYCDIIQVEDDTLKLPTIARRAGYILSSVLLPYSLSKILPSFRARLRKKLESNLSRLTNSKKQHTRAYKLQSYILRHLSTLTSPSPVHALTLTIFYFSGAYYQLSKRLWGLRYIFTKRIAPSEARVGYEVLGVLLLLQMSVQTYLHLHQTLQPPTLSNPGALTGSSAMLDNGIEISTSSTNTNEILLAPSQPHLSPSKLSLTTHTPILSKAHFDLSNEKIMPWIKGQNRKCTLCLEDMKDPSAATCGHVFCWECIRDWVREKAECPLCRRAVGAQHVLPLRG